MISDYSNRHMRPSDQVVNNSLPPVRVTRAWRGVTKGQILDSLPKRDRHRLLRGGFVEIVEAKTPPPVRREPFTAKKKASKKTAKKKS